MRFTLEIELGNDGMLTYRNIADALSSAAVRVYGYGGDALADEPVDRGILDDNGNTVGSWHIKE